MKIANLLFVIVIVIVLSSCNVKKENDKVSTDPSMVKIDTVTLNHFIGSEILQFNMACPKILDEDGTYIGNDTKIPNRYKRSDTCSDLPDQFFTLKRVKEKFLSSCANIKSSNIVKEDLYLTNISHEVFANTDCHNCHKNGTHIDIDFPRSLIIDGNDYSSDDRKQAEEAIVIFLNNGFKKAIYDDKVVVDAVNRRVPGNMARTDPSGKHGNHIHIEYPLSLAFSKKPLGLDYIESIAGTIDGDYLIFNDLDEDYIQVCKNKKVLDSLFIFDKNQFKISLSGEYRNFGDYVVPITKIEAKQRYRERLLEIETNITCPSVFYGDELEVVFVRESGCGTIIDGHIVRLYNGEICDENERMIDMSKYIVKDKDTGKTCDGLPVYEYEKKDS